MIDIICVNNSAIEQNSYHEEPTYYDPAINGCDAGSLVALSTNLFDSIYQDGFTSYDCLAYDGTNYNLDTPSKTSTSCQSDNVLISQGNFAPLQYSYLITNATPLPLMPTPIQIVDAFGAGFFVVLPIFLTILGGRLVLKSIFLSK